MNPDFMLAEMLEQPLVMHRILSETLPAVEALVGEVGRPGRMVLTGSGDSFCAAQCGAWGLRAVLHGDMGGISSVRPLDLARYRHDLLGPDTWLVAISASGRTRRVLEAVAAARARGARILAVTDDPAGPLAVASDHLLMLCASPPEALAETDYQDPRAREYVGYHHDVPQTKTFTASVFLTYAFACTLKPRRAGEWLAALHALPRLVESILVDCADSAAAAAKAVIDAEVFIFLGSGAELPNARYGAFKMYEFVRKGLWQEMEEYCHTQYFITRAGTPVLFLADDPFSLERAGEVAPFLMDSLKARCILMTTGLPPAGFSHVVPIPAEGPRAFHPLLISLAIQRFAHALARHAGLDTSTFRGGLETERYVAGSLEIVRASRILEPGELGACTS